MFWIIVIILVVLFILIGTNGMEKQKKVDSKLVELGYSKINKIETGKYVSGHPSINESIQKTSIFQKGNDLEIMLEAPFETPVKKGKIEISFIKNILIEDQSTVEKRVTVGRLLVAGIFALAWKKKKKNELAFLIIEWNDGKFDHETIFEFEGVGSMQNANTARNKLIRIVR